MFFSLILLIAIIPALASCVQLGHNCSSYFTLSFLKIPPSVEDIGAFKADSELACAFRCCAQRECTEAVFFKGSRTCSLYNAKEAVLTESQADSEETRTGYIRIKKVRVKLSRKRSVWTKCTMFSSLAFYCLTNTLLSTDFGTQKLY